MNVELIMMERGILLNNFYGIFAVEGMVNMKKMTIKAGITINY